MVYHLENLDLKSVAIITSSLNIHALAATIKINMKQNNIRWMKVYIERKGFKVNTQILKRKH